MRPLFLYHFTEYVLYHNACVFYKGAASPYYGKEILYFTNKNNILNNGDDSPIEHALINSQAINKG